MLPAQAAQHKPYISVAVRCIGGSMPAVFTLLLLLLIVPGL
jgi:hypothetical protein